MTCKHGHDLSDPANSYVRPGTNWRGCRQCRREACRRWRQDMSDEARERKRARDRRRIPTPAEKARKAQNLRDWRARMTPEQRERVNRRQRELSAQRTPEQLARAAERERARRATVEQRAERTRQLREWQRANPDKVADARHRRRASVVRSPSDDDRAYLAVIDGDPCAYCGGPGEVVDHIEPLSDGGEHRWENLTRACLSCNSSKGPKSLLPWLAQRERVAA